MSLVGVHVDPDTSQPAGAAAVLRSTKAIRERAQVLLHRARTGDSAWFSVDDDSLVGAAAEVADLTRARYPDLRIPFHSRWRHFEAGGVDRKAELDGRAMIDLTVVSVLLDAGAGPDWSYLEASTGQRFSRSEGLGVASWHAFCSGMFSSDPARPLQTLALDGCLPAPKHQRFTRTQCNNLSGVGIATQGVNDDGVPAILRESTTYQKNLYGQGDDAYELVPTLATLSALFRSQRFAITSKYPRHKLADDGTRFGAGQAIVTPKIIKAELIAQYRADEFLGRVENAQAFKQNLIVERDPNDPNRVNVLYPPDLINQLRIFAVLAQFRLQYNRGVENVTTV